MKFSKIIVVAVCFLAIHAHAQLKLPTLFSDNMVLQQKSSAKIWGWADKKAEVAIKASWTSEVVKVKADKEGKWSTSIATNEAGGPYELIVTSGNTVTIKNVMLGEVWLCSGQSNMEMPMKGFLGEPVENSNQAIVRSKNSNIRTIIIPRNSVTNPVDNFEGSWVEASPSTTGNFSATAYYFAKLVNELTNVPIGLVDVTFGGSNVEAWMSKESIGDYKSLPIPANDEEIKEKNRTPTVLYNGMLSPVIGFTIKGAIWYQGESNADRPLEYEKLFGDMVSLWRSKWGQGDFPFYYAQIAPFDYDMLHKESPWFANSAYLRDAQRKAQYSIPNSAMACLLDVGNMKTIHPTDKKSAGERLAWLALRDSYDFEGFGAKTPDFQELNIEDSLVTVTFKNLESGITSFFKEVTAFQIAGEDKVFYPAQCRVRRKSVQVWSDKVKKPVAVRYAFTNEGPAQLFGADGIPVTSFRTDNWNPEEVKFADR